jgi:hypothetical protein
VPFDDLLPQREKPPLAELAPIATTAVCD